MSSNQTSKENATNERVTIPFSNPKTRRAKAVTSASGRNEIIVRNMMSTIEAPLYDIGVLSHRGMLPGLDSIPAEEVLKRLSLLIVPQCARIAHH